VEKLLLIREIKQKTSKTKTEEMLLEFYSAIWRIDEILINHSKQHINSQNAIEKVRNVLQNIK
jgi:hypothetical protein